MMLASANVSVWHPLTSPLRGEVGAKRRVRGAMLGQGAMLQHRTPHPSSATSLALLASLPSPLRGEGALGPIIGDEA